MDTQFARKSMNLNYERLARQQKALDFLDEYALPDSGTIIALRSDISHDVVVLYRSSEAEKLSATLREMFEVHESTKEADLGSNTTIELHTVVVRNGFTIDLQVKGAKLTEGCKIVPTTSTYYTLACEVK